jgi:hypothetical protein
MTVLSRALIRRMIIQEMRLSAPSRPFKPKLSSGLSFDDDDTLEINTDTEITEIPSFMTGFEDTEIDFDSDVDDFGLELDDYEDDFEFESETEEDPDPESETEYNPGRHIMDMSGDEIRRHVMSQAAQLSPDMSARNRKTRAEMEYDRLVKLGREAEMADPEFQDTAELPPYEQRKKDLREHISKRVRQLIRRQMLLR